MMRVCPLQYRRSWYKNLPYAEFSYNNSCEDSWRWHRLRCYMVVGVEPHYFGARLENGRFLNLTYGKKPRDKFVWWEKECGSHSLGRRAMPTISEYNWVLKLEIACTSSLHLVSLVPSWSRKREENLKAEFLNFFSDPSKSRGQDSF
jgi:hypothetical protein